MSYAAYTYNNWKTYVYTAVLVIYIHVISMYSVCRQCDITLIYSIYTVA